MLPYFSKKSFDQKLAGKNTVTKISDKTALTLISGYQRHLSPIKGFKCAAGQVYGNTTCSAAIKAIVQHHGLVAGFPAIQQQLKNCHTAAQHIKANPNQFQAGVFCCVLPIPL